MKKSDDLLTNYCVIMTHSHSDVESSTLVKYGKSCRDKTFTKLSMEGCKVAGKLSYATGLINDFEIAQQFYAQEDALGTPHTFKNALFQFHRLKHKYQLENSFSISMPNNPTIVEPLYEKNYYFLDSNVDQLREKYEEEVQQFTEILRSTDNETEKQEMLKLISNYERFFIKMMTNNDSYGIYVIMSTAPEDRAFSVMSVDASNWDNVLPLNLLKNEACRNHFLGKLPKQKRHQLSLKLTNEMCESDIYELFASMNYNHIFFIDRGCNEFAQKSKTDFQYPSFEEGVDESRYTNMSPHDARSVSYTRRMSHRTQYTPRALEDSKNQSRKLHSKMSPLRKFTMKKQFSVEKKYNKLFTQFKLNLQKERNIKTQQAVSDAWKKALLGADVKFSDDKKMILLKQ